MSVAKLLFLTAAILVNDRHGCLFAVVLYKEKGNRVANILGKQGKWLSCFYSSLEDYLSFTEDEQPQFTESSDFKRAKKHSGKEQR